MDFFENLGNNPGEPSTQFGKHGLKALQEDFQPPEEVEGGTDRAVEAARQERKLEHVEQAAMRVQLDDQSVFQYGAARWRSISKQLLARADSPQTHGSQDLIICYD